MQAECTFAKMAPVEDCPGGSSEAAGAQEGRNQWLPAAHNPEEPQLYAAPPPLHAEHLQIYHNLQIHYNTKEICR